MAVPQSQAVELGISLGMSEDEVLGYKAQFDATDLDGGGTISNDELKQVLRKCGVSVTDAEVKRYILEFDTDGDGVLDFAEFLGMMHKFNQGPSEKDMRKAMFEFLDENLDAMVSLSELKEFWKKAAQESGGTVEYPSDGDLRQLFANTDLDRDGYINEDEFFALCEALFPGKE